MVDESMLVWHVPLQEREGGKLQTWSFEGVIPISLTKAIIIYLIDRGVYPRTHFLPRL